MSAAGEPLPTRKGDITVTVVKMINDQDTITRIQMAEFASGDIKPSPAEVQELARRLLAADAEFKKRREAMKPLAGIDLESAVDRLAENCNSIQGVWCSDKRSAYYSGFRDGAAIGLNAEKNGSDDE